MSELLWWGYRHIDGGLQVKRYWSPRDIEEARDSDFCAYTYGPFTALDRPDALRIAGEHI